MKMTKAQFIERLRKINLKSLKDDTVKGIVTYTLKVYDGNPRDVTLDDLKEVLADLKEAKVELPALENLAPVAEVKKSEPEPEAEPEPKKKTVAKKKAVAKKKTEEKVEPEKKPEAKPEAKAEVVKKPKAKAQKFPDEIKLGEQTIKRVGVLKDYIGKDTDERLYTVGIVEPEVLHDEETYNDLGFVPKKLKSLPENLDVVNLVWVTPRVVYGVSVYTEVFYTFLNGKGNLPVYVEV